MVDGKRRETSLCRWRGTPPEPGEQEGDAAFEQSRERAQAMLKKALEGRHDTDEELRDAQRVHDLRYGGKVERLKLAELVRKWDALPHKKGKVSEGWVELVHTVLRRFVAYMHENAPGVTEAGALTAAHFKGFLESVEKRGVSGKTWNDHLSILRSALRKLDGDSRGFREYLAKLPKRPETIVHRKPFSGVELEAIYAAAAEIDPELRPVIVAAACTALRRGDVCRLRWDAVDLGEGFVTVKTSKTGETVEIPIFPPFRAVLEEAEAVRKASVPYVWPGIALAYARNPDSLNIRLQKVLAAAGFVRPEKAVKEGKYPAPEDEEAAALKLEDGMARAGWTAKRKAKARRILALHFEGKSGQEIAAEIGTSGGGVSDYLHAIEETGEMALVSPPKREAPARATLAEIQEGEPRARRGSLCGWHSFRTTFCTLALAHGVPMEILRRITGHQTAEIVLKHYDRRGREEMRKAFAKAMPKAIVGAIGTGGAASGNGMPIIDVEAVEVEPVPADVAKLARMLAGADAATLAKVAKMLAKK
jgi:integrase